MNFTIRTMLSLSLFVVLFAAYTSSVVAQSAFDFSLSASGSHNVVQGHDLYIANSSWKCNETFFEKYFVWSSIAKGLAGTIV